MGIKDAAHALEAWLIRIAARAFYYQLPDGFVPTMIIQDFTALMVSAFHSTSSKTGHDYVQYLARPLHDFGRSEMRSDEEVKRAPVNFEQHCTSVERQRAAKAQKEADETDAMDIDNPSTPRFACPTLDDLVQRNEEEPESFLPAVRKRCLFVLARDNPRYLPENRAMLHEKRYSGSRDAAYTDEELTKECFHVVTHRPLPGYTTFEAEEQLPDFAAIRRRAAHTSMIRDAYQQFGPWALLRQLREERASNDLTDERRVCIDSVLSTFPADYAKTELHALPKHWAKGPQSMEVVHLTTGRHDGSFKPPPVGETDLKFVWYIEHMAKAGDHVLIRCNDSDVLYILLLHMHRFIQRGVVVFLDIRTHNMSKERYEHRFICLNALAEAISLHAAVNWPGLACPLQVVAFVALNCGSDYTSNPYMVGSKTIVDTFCTHGWRLLKDLFRVGNIQSAPENAWITAAHLKPALTSDALAKLTWPTLLIMDTTAAHAFVRTLYQDRVGSAYLQREFQVPEGNLLSWSELAAYSLRRYASHKKAVDFIVPSEEEAESDLRRLLWTTLYWSNAHLNVGLFPSTLTMIEEEEKPAWGYIRCPESITDGEGVTRALKLASHTPKRIVDDYTHAKEGVLSKASSDVTQAMRAVEKAKIAHQEAVAALAITTESLKKAKARMDTVDPAALPWDSAYTIASEPYNNLRQKATHEQRLCDKAKGALVTETANHSKAKVVFHKVSASQDQWLVCHCKVVAPYAALWNMLLSEWIHLTVIANAESSAPPPKEDGELSDDVIMDE